MKKFVIVWLSLAPLACTVKLATPAQADVDRVAARFPDYSLSALNEGKNLYEVHCQTCHGLKKPASRTEDQWKDIMPRMVNRVNRKARKDVLTARERELLLKYVVTMGQK